MHFCALRFLHFKVFATLASGRERPRLTLKTMEQGLPLLRSLAIDWVITQKCLTVEAMSLPPPIKHFFSLAARQSGNENSRVREKDKRADQI
jgi:hypothetical protein